MPLPPRETVPFTWLVPVAAKDNVIPVSAGAPAVLEVNCVPSVVDKVQPPVIPRRSLTISLPELFPSNAVTFLDVASVSALLTKLFSNALSPLLTIVVSGIWPKFKSGTAINCNVPPSTVNWAVDLAVAALLP